MQVITLRTVCQVCRGKGVDPRTVKTGEGLTSIVRPCPRCDGAGVPLPASERDFARAI